MILHRGCRDGQLETLFQPFERIGVDGKRGVLHRFPCPVTAGISRMERLHRPAALPRAGCVESSGDMGMEPPPDGPVSLIPIPDAISPIGTRNMTRSPDFRHFILSSGGFAGPSRARQALVDNWFTGTV